MLRKLIPAALFICLFASARAMGDQTIMTPSSTSLSAGEMSATIAQGIDKNPGTAAWGFYGSPYGEIEIANFYHPGTDIAAISTKLQIAPELNTTPSLSAGIRDINNVKSNLAEPTYRGISPYVMIGRSPIQFVDRQFPINNLSYTAGVGANGIKGLFGSLTADLTKTIHWTVEWDSCQFNEKISMPVLKAGSVSYERIGKDNYVGISFVKMTGI
jgi:hypothetical protein